MAVDTDFYYSQYFPDLSVSSIAGDIVVAGGAGPDLDISPLQFLIDMPISVGCFEVSGFVSS